MIADRWGVSDAEVARRYPCDDVVGAPTMAAWRGVSVAAPPAAVWPWVRQLRLAPYSYDWVDNLGRRSPRELADLPETAVGQAFTACGGRPLGTVVSVDPGEQLTARIAGAVMSYVLVPDVAGTRLLMKIVADVPRPFAPLLAAGDLVMARRQLLNIRDLAESGQSSRRSSFG